MSEFKVKAICPSCRRTYIANLRYKWNGRGVARIYCPSCKGTQKSQYTGIQVIHKL